MDEGVVWKWLVVGVWVVVVVFIWANSVKVDELTWGVGWLRVQQMVDSSACRDGLLTTNRGVDALRVGLNVTQASIQELAAQMPPRAQYGAYCVASGNDSVVVLTCRGMP